MSLIVKASITQALNQITVYTHNRKTSARLLYNYRATHKDKPLQWCVEQVIYQLLRDRR